jgi:hypothetical protein
MGEGPYENVARSGVDRRRGEATNRLEMGLDAGARGIVRVKSRARPI